MTVEEGRIEFVFDGENPWPRLNVVRNNAIIHLSKRDVLALRDYLNRFLPGH